MKKIKISLVILSLILVLASCKSEDGPETITRKFANHFAAAEFTEAKKYGTESTIQLIEIMEALASVGYYQDPDEIVLLKDSDIDCQVDGDKAVCTYLELGELVGINLLRTDGLWLVDFNMDDFFSDDNWYDEDEDDDDWRFDGTEIQLN